MAAEPRRCQTDISKIHRYLHFIQVKWQPADTFSCGCKYRIAQSRGQGRKPWFTYSFDYRSAISQDIHFNDGHFIDPQHSVVIKISLQRFSIFKTNSVLGSSYDGHHNGSFNLGFNIIGVYHRSQVNHRVDLLDLNCSVWLAGYFDHLSAQTSEKLILGYPAPPTLGQGFIPAG